MEREVSDESTQVARTWRELDDLLFEGSWNPRVGRFRSLNAFRGVARIDRDLRTGVMRLGGDVAAKERHLVRNFRKYARRSFVGDDSIWNWLSLAQHHGLPTRLLDWSYSPHVALHFATANASARDVDAEVWVVAIPEINEHLPEVLARELEEEGSHVFTGEILSRVAATPGELGARSDEPFALFLEPPALTERIVNQAALFSLMSTATDRFDHWLDGHPGASRRIILPADLKLEVRDRLDQMNISERVLTPGLDGLSQWLARYYRESL